MLLSRLGSACPALQQLQLNGTVDRELVAMFGVSCSRLSHLVIRNATHVDTFRQLHLLLPCLSHCKMMYDAEQNMLESGFCLAVLTCKTLTGLNIGRRNLCFEGVEMLPPALNELECAFADNPPTALLPHLRALRKLVLHIENVTNSIKLPTLAGVLHAAPGLRSLHMSGRNAIDYYDDRLGVVLECTHASVADLLLFSNRIEAGLVVTAEDRQSKKPISLELQLNNLQPGFLNFLPPLPAFTSVVLNGTPMLSYFEMIQGVDTAFPNLDCLEVSRVYKLDDLQLTHLASCSALRSLTLDSVDVSPIGLTMFCSRLPSLRLLTIKNCSRCHIGVKQMVKVFEAWGLHIQVMMVEHA